MKGKKCQAAAACCCPPRKNPQGVALRVFADMEKEKGRNESDPKAAGAPSPRGSCCAEVLHRLPPHLYFAVRVAVLQIALSGVAVCRDLNVGRQNCSLRGVLRSSSASFARCSVIYLVLIEPNKLTSHSESTQHVLHKLTRNERSIQAKEFPSS